MDDVGANIAEATARRLQELNPDVVGSHLPLLLEEAVKQEDLWKNFTMVVVCGAMPQALLDALLEILWPANTPLLAVATAGFYATLTVIARETVVVDTHDPSKTYDLRIDRPWSELASHAESYDMAALDDTEHAHVPYVVIFLKALGRWKQEHDGLPPQTYPEKREFRSEYIEKMSRNFALEPNFIEAAQAVHRALQITRVPASVRLLVAESRAMLVDFHTPFFWLYVRALGEFLDANDDVLPLPGNIPDMASTTASYVALQKMYQHKADSDRECFSAELAKVFAQAGRSRDEINPIEVATFCKNTGFLHVSRGSRRLFSDTLIDKLHQPDGYDLVIYFGILALHEWTSTGKIAAFDAYASCFETITGISRTQFTPAITNTLTEIFTHDLASYHNICSLIGGIAGQEALKIATAQYIPLDNLYIFDGVRATSSKWKI